MRYLCQESQWNISFVVRLTRDSPELYSPGEKGYEIFKGAVVRGPSLVLCRKRESVRTSSKTRRCVQEFWPTTPTRCIQAQWRSLRNGRKRQGATKSLSKFCRETDGLDSPTWTSRCQESYGRSSKKCRRCFKTNPFQARLYRSTWKTTWRTANANPINENWLAPFQTKRSCCTCRCRNGISTIVWKLQLFTEPLTMFRKKSSRSSWTKSRRTGVRAIKVQSRHCLPRYSSFWGTARMVRWSTLWTRPWSIQRVEAPWGKICARCGFKIWKRLASRSNIISQAAEGRCRHAR